ncbi:hypothetical protein BDZ97DRAFT_24667 [Flammula alnicola]|nr:hypothetical protein BDZ97DRAFT_24667 [Flammula alnicola]
MEAYFPVVAKRSIKGKGQSFDLDSKEEPVAPDTGDGDERPKGNKPPVEFTLSSSAITKGLLNTLSDVSNPITHSDIYERTDHVTSFATGHQVSDSRVNQASYMATREVKLRAQQVNAKSTSDGGILKETRIYIDGYLESTTDLEMKRLVVEAGGQIVHSASRCTHILTSRGLSGSKTHKILTNKMRTNVYVVKPEWVLDSIAKGKRRPERPYTIVKRANTLESFLQA